MCRLTPRFHFGQLRPLSFPLAFRVFQFHGIQLGDVKDPRLGAKKPGKAAPKRKTNPSGGQLLQDDDDDDSRGGGGSGCCCAVS